MKRAIFTYRESVMAEWNEMLNCCAPNGRCYMSFKSNAGEKLCAEATAVAGSSRRLDEVLKVFGYCLFKVLDACELKTGLR